MGSPGGEQRARRIQRLPLGFLNLAGEDFAHYMERIPGCFLRNRRA
jgi:hypothetical protein